MYPDIAGWVLIVCASAFTLAAAVIDYRIHKIPNYLTLPAFALGWVYQLTFYGLPGLLDGLAGFAVGFGMYFVLWLIGSGGGGDAKLAGAVSVWLGFNRTIGMIICSTVFVILGTGFVMLWSMLTKGVYKTKNQMLPGSDVKNKKRLELLKINRGRLGMTFGLSVALGTILVTAYDVPRRLHKEQVARQRAEESLRSLKKKTRQNNDVPKDAVNSSTKPTSDEKNS